MWYYIPIAIRFILNNEDKAGVYDSISGAHFIQYESSQNITKSYVMTICHSLKHLDGNVEIAINTKYLNTKDVVRWYECKLISERAILTESDATFNVLSSFKQNQFLFLPNDLNGGNLSDIRLLIVQPFNNKLHDLVGLKHYKPFSICSCVTGDLISLRTYPFNQTNSILFNDFVSRGYINYINYAKGKPIIYLTDLRYLDNMVGGIVNSDRGSVGLILGNLRKSEGQGNLAVIISWEQAWMMFSSLTEMSCIQIVKPMHHESVLPIVVSGKTSQTWGSCVYYNNYTLITNNHVIKEFIDDPINTKCFIYISPDISIELNSNDKILTPFTGLDLSFLELKNDNLKRLSQNRKPININKNYDKGDTVKTKSFGLFLNKSSVTPIESIGVLSSKFLLPFYESSNTKTPCLLVTSASCWNGSSGGGLFDTSDRMVGLICSNAVVRIPSLGYETKELETIPDFSMCLPIDIIEACFNHIQEKSTGKINHKIEKLWNLNTFHKDVIVKESKF